MKILKNIHKQKRFPVLSALLVISCLMTSIPQLFLPNVYNEITGQFPNIKSIYLITLPVFSHSPEIFFNHLIGNILVILLFGSLIEIILGSSKFSIITLFSFISTTSLNYFHSSGNGSSHGISGLCFGYIVFFIFFIVILIENKKYFIFKNPIILFSMIIAVFSIIGIPIFEVVFLKQRLFNNFGQTIHLLSYSIVTPLLLLWRKEFEENIIAILNDNKIKKSNSIKIIPIIILILILLMNLFSTIYVSIKSLKVDDNFVYSIILESDKTTEPKTVIKIQTNNDLILNSEKLTTKSINYESEIVPEIKFLWKNNKTIFLEFSRIILPTESIYLKYNIKREILNGIDIEEIIEITYKGI